MIKIDPSQLHFVDLQDPSNFVKMLITASHEHQSFISFSEQNIFTTSKIIAWVAKSHPVVIIPSSAIESMDNKDKKPVPFGYEFFYLSCSPAVYQDLSEVFGVQLGSNWSYLITSKLKVYPLGVLAPRNGSILD